MKLQYAYVVDTNNWDNQYSTIEEAQKDGLTLDKILVVFSELLLNDSHGQYIPKIFYEHFNFAQWNLDKKEYECLENPDHEWYWEEWNELINKAKYIQNGLEYSLWQAGDLFAQATMPASEFLHEEN